MNIDDTYESSEVVEYTTRFFPAVTLETFPHIFKLQADTVARFLEKKDEVLKK